MNEVELIRNVCSGLPKADTVIVGPGDDCAVVDVTGSERLQLLKTDAVVEGIHFDRQTDARLVGRKALARALSDIAAMGGRPDHALITLGLPERFEASWVEEAYAGLVAIANDYGVTVVGGETTRNPGGYLLSISLTGWVEKTSLVRRSGAETGDAIFVSGELGGSGAGHHLTFTPRLNESAWLCEEHTVHAMIDISDGLASDLRHLLSASGRGAEIRLASLPVSRAAKLAEKEGSGSKPARLAALTDGEDFELLFCCRARDAVQLLDGWRQVFPDVPLTCIGKIMENEGLFLRDEHGVKPAPDHGYLHF